MTELEYLRKEVEELKDAIRNAHDDSCIDFGAYDILRDSDNRERDYLLQKKDVA